MKNMPRGMRFLVCLVSSFFVLFLFVFFAEKVNAEEDSNTVDWTNVDFTDVEDIDKEGNVVLFLGNECEACDALYISIQKFELNKYIPIQIVNGHSDEAKEVMKELLENEGYSTDPLVLPVLFHQDYTTIGYTSCNAYIQALNRLKTSEAWLAHVQSVAKEIYEEEKAATENKSLIEVIKELDLGTLIVIGVSLALVIAGGVVLFVKREQFHPQWRVALSLMEVLLLGGSLVFFVNLVNSKKQYIPEESLAGCVDNGKGGWDCATYAELVTQRAQHASDDGEVSKLERQSQREAAKIHGDNWKDVQVATTLTDPGSNPVLQQSFQKVVEGSEAIMEAKSKSATFAKGLEECAVFTGSTYSQCVSNAASNESAEVKSLVNKYIQQSSPNDYIVIQFSDTIGKNKLESICGELDLKIEGDLSLTECVANYSNKIMSTYNSEILAKYGNIEEMRKQCEETYTGTDLARCKEFIPYAAFTLAMDPVTKTIIKNPIGISVIEDVCTDHPTEGGNTTVGSQVCICDSGIATRYSTNSNVNCDIVCRARNLTCETCNPPVVRPIAPIPVKPGTPYCGDGILGNTSGEQCEIDDPSGVSCSWVSCSNCKCPVVEQPFCGDGKVNVTGEQCELGNPSGTSCTWDNCNQSNCKCVTPGCGDGKLDTGEKCENGDPAGYTCKWEECNQLKCQCIEPGCGDGKLDAGEKCEKGNPAGATCLWEECNKTSCICEVKELESCGDGKLQDGEQCEEGDPSGTSCTWDKCSKSTCLCPIVPVVPVETYPQTSVFESSYMRNIVLGGVLLILGILFYPMAQFIDNMYITVGNKALKIGRYVTRPDEVTRNKKKKKIENNFK